MRKRPNYTDEQRRVIDAYTVMAINGYRPNAPGDGLGNLRLSLEEIENRELLEAEAFAYAQRFIAEAEAGGSFFIGIPHFNYNRGMVYTIEAARLMAGAAPPLLIAALLGLATREICTADIWHDGRWIERASAKDQT